MGEQKNVGKYSAKPEAFSKMQMEEKRQIKMTIFGMKSYCGTMNFCSPNDFFFTLAPSIYRDMNHVVHDVPFRYEEICGSWNLGSFQITFFVPSLIYITT